MSTVAQRVHELIDGMTRAERSAARALLATYPLLGLRTVAEFASGAGVSSPTILRFVDRLGYHNYGGFQNDLHDELAQQLKPPLEKVAPLEASGRPLDDVARAISSNIEATMASLPASEIQEVIALLGEERFPVFATGGRFTDMMARFLSTHLGLMRPGVTHLDRAEDARRDRLIDMPKSSRIVCFDIRRYDSTLAEFAASASARGAIIILFTDQWISPVSASATHVLPARVDVPSIWDSHAGLLTVVETILAGVAHQTWDKTTERLRMLESLRPNPGPESNWDSIGLHEGTGGR